MATNPVEFADRIGAELTQLLGRHCRAELLQLKQEEQFSAAIGASLICIAEVLRDPVKRGVPASRLIAICAKQLEALLASA